MRTRTILLITVMVLTLGLIGCGGETSNNSITLSEADAGIDQMNFQIEKAIALIGEGVPGVTEESAFSIDGVYSIETVMFDNVSYGGDVIDGEYTVLEDTVDNSYNYISFDLTVNNYTLTGTLYITSSSPTDELEIISINGTLNISGGLISTIEMDVSIAITTDPITWADTVEMTGTVTVNGKAFNINDLPESVIQS